LIISFWDSVDSHIHNPLHNISSHEFLRAVNRTYEQVSSCINDQWMLKEKGIKLTFRFPDDAEEHFQLLKNKTEIFRRTPVHNYAEYGGPWLENFFIHHFLNRHLSHFRGFIPLFLQWIDTEILHRMDEMHNALNEILRPDVLYLAISQGDAGLGKIGLAHPNILVLSAGGFGHVPLPLIKGEIPYENPPEKYDRDFGFFGTNRPERRDLNNRMRQAAQSHHMSIAIASGPNWKHDMKMTKYNLAPRGYGRTSFRFAE
jgi:hypothetical protein